jgi:hypothetical protein
VRQSLARRATPVKAKAGAAGHGPLAASEKAPGGAGQPEPEACGQRPRGATPFDAAGDSGAGRCRGESPAAVGRRQRVVKKATRSPGGPLSSTVEPEWPSQRGRRADPGSHPVQPGGPSDASTRTGDAFNQHLPCRRPKGGGRVTTRWTCGSTCDAVFGGGPRGGSPRRRQPCAACGQRPVHRRGASPATREQTRSASAGFFRNASNPAARAPEASSRPVTRIIHTHRPAN